MIAIKARHKISNTELTSGCWHAVGLGHHLDLQPADRLRHGACVRNRTVASTPVKQPLHMQQKAKLINDSSLLQVLDADKLRAVPKCASDTLYPFCYCMPLPC